MPEKTLTYNRFLQCLLALTILLMLGGCKVFSSLREEEQEYQEEESFLNDEARERYLDSLQMVEYCRFIDSCGMVLEAEMDSILKTLANANRSSYSEAVADSIVAYAMEFLNTPYKNGGNGPKVFDCSGFTKFVFRRFGINLKRTAVGQLNDGWKTIDNQEELRRGDLVFYGGRSVPSRMGHVGIVVDNDPESHRFTFIHATLKKGVIISVSTEKYYRIRYMTACRILPE